MTKYEPHLKTGSRINFRTGILDPPWHATAYTDGMLKVEANLPAQGKGWELGNFWDHLPQERQQQIVSVLSAAWQDKYRINRDSNTFGILSRGLMTLHTISTNVVSEGVFSLGQDWGVARGRLSYARGYMSVESRNALEEFYRTHPAKGVTKLDLTKIREIENFNFNTIPVADEEIIEHLQADFESVQMLSQESLGLHVFKVGEFARKPRFVGDDVMDLDHTLGTVYALKTEDLPSELTLDKYEFEFSASQRDEWDMTHIDIADNPALHQDQLRAVNAHLSTDFGVVNAMATGEGKTISTLITANIKADGRPNYRMLVVVEAAVRDQWRKEAKEWLSNDFQVVTLHSRKEADVLDQALDNTQPTVILCSYSLLSRIEEPESRFDELFAGAHFDDIVLDEGRTVRGSNKTARSLWHIRRNSDVGVVLCATPVLKSVDDMSALMAWARNHPEVKNKTVKELFGKMTTKKEFERWYEWWGKALIRSSGSSAQMSNMNPPKIRTKVLMVTPTPQELEVSTAISGRIRESMVNIIETYKTMGNSLDSEQERQLRGQILATSSISRQASSDPRMLSHSDTAIAGLLRADGTLRFPDDFTPVKVQETVDLCKTLTKGDEPGPVVIFTEFKYTANSLETALTKEGIVARQFIGGMARKKRDENLQDFNSGKAQVLIATSAAERGLNLQVARHMIHFDHKFTPDSIFQRTGRLTRINSGWEHVNIYFLVTKGTMDEKVFSVAVARSGLAGASATHSIEDFAKSERGKMISNLTEHAHKEAMNRASENGLLSLTEALVS